MGYIVCRIEGVVKVQNRVGIDMEYISDNQIKNILKPKRRESHKGDNGKILIIGGSKGMAGAAVLAARAALRSGSGLVRVSANENIFPILQTSVVEATCIDRSLSKSTLMEYDAIGIGPGLGTDNDGLTALKKVLVYYNGPLIIDADAINLIALNNIDIKQYQGEIILTPHPGEAGRLLGRNASEVNKNRTAAVRDLVEKTGAAAILKGYETLVMTSRSGEIYINTTGNPGMATGGSGDVLTGLLTSLAGQGLTTFEAAISAVYIHGLAGDMCAAETGEYGLTASDIAYTVAKAIKKSQE